MYNNNYSCFIFQFLLIEQKRKQRASRCKKQNITIRAAETQTCRTFGRSDDRFWRAVLIKNINIACSDIYISIGVDGGAKIAHFCKIRQI